MTWNLRGLLGHGTAVLLFAALSLFILVLTILEVQRHRKYQEFEADRKGEELFRSMRDGIVNETADLPAPVAGIGVYSPGGFPFILLGVVPSSLDPAFFPPKSDNYWLEGEGDTYFLVKSLQDPSPKDPVSPLPAAKNFHGNNGYLLVHIQDPGIRSYTLMLWGLYAIGQGVLLALAFLIWRLQNHNQDLAQRLRLREESDFLGDVGSVLAHEIKNPLSTILLQARILEDTPESRESGELIAQETLRITELVERVRDLVRDPQGKPEKLSLQNLLQGPGYEGLLPPVPDAQIFMDPLRFRSVLGNLLENARESQGGNGPPPFLVLEITGGKVTLEIRDQGVGITPHQRQRLFTPFHTTKSSGTGLGLALVRRFMEGAGGTVDLISRPEGGVTARLQWPEVK